MINKSLPYPFDTTALRNAGMLNAPAYTYLMHHVPTGSLYFSHAVDMRTTANMWAHRLRNPDGNSKVPFMFNTLGWVPEDWRLQVGKPYESNAAAIAAKVHGMSVAHASGHSVLNRQAFRGCREPAGTVRKPGEPELKFPRDMAEHQLAMPWPELLDWLLDYNRSRNPSDAQVRALWIAYHNRRGNNPPSIVYDPDRIERHGRAARKAASNRKYREVIAGHLPRTWHKLK